MKLFLQFLVPCFVLAGVSAQADPLLGLDIASANYGEQVSWYQCPCFRVEALAQGPRGTVETDNFIFSSDSLFQYETQSPQDSFQNPTVRLWKVGAIEALWKGRGIGLGFKGVEWGEDDDRGYSNLVRTGMYVLKNILRTEASRLDIRSGADFETMRVNLGPQVDVTRLDQALVYRLRKGKWKGDFIAHVGLAPESFTGTGGTSWGASGNLTRGLFDFHGLDLAATANLAFEHDGYREEIGLEPDLASETLLLQLSYIPGGHR